MVNHDDYHGKSLIIHHGKWLNDMKCSYDADVFGKFCGASCQPHALQQDSGQRPPGRIGSEAVAPPKEWKWNGVQVGLGTVDWDVDCDSNCDSNCPKNHLKNEGNPIQGERLANSAPDSWHLAEEGQNCTGALRKGRRLVGSRSLGAPPKKPQVLISACTGDPFSIRWACKS